MGKENRSLYPGLRYIEVLYIMRFHCHLSEKAMNDQTKKIGIPPFILLRDPSSRNVPQRRGARKNVCFLRLPHSIIAKYVSCRSSKLRESLKQSIRVNVVQVKPLVRYISILVKKSVSIMFIFTLISLLRHDRQCR